MSRKPTIAIIGAGSFANGLIPSLQGARYTISEIIGRDSPSSRRRTRLLAKKVGARDTTVSSAILDATLLWFCVPDREIRAVASAVTLRSRGGIKYAFHSSGVLTSRDLAPLSKRGIAVAAVHPLMTFVPGSQPSLANVPFALEGDPAAVRLARRIVSDLNGESFSLRQSHKSAYHTWATLTSPLLVAFLANLEESARLAGLTKQDSRRMSRPIIQQTLANYFPLGPARSFSGPIIRGDVATVARHLATFRKHPQLLNVYVALARSALHTLPAKNRSELIRLLK